MLPFLTGVKVIEITTIILGPMIGQMLADMGAEVVKIETLEGDQARQVPPLSPEGMGAMFANNNRNKHSLSIDLKTAEGAGILRDLVGSADIFLHNMRRDAAMRLGCDGPSLRAVNPRLVYCAAIGFGSQGPDADLPAYDDIIQAASGLASLPVEMGREPDYVPSVIADKTVALYAAMALLGALRHRDRTGIGVEIEVPMFETMVSLLFNEHLDAATFDPEGRPGYRRLLNRHRRPFQTRDDWIAVLPYSDAQWQRLLTGIGRDDVLAQPWMASTTERSAHIDDLYAILAQALRAHSTAYWCKLFTRLDIPHAPINRLTDLLNHPHLQATQFFAPTDSLAGRARSVPLPIRITWPSQPALRDTPPPKLGNATESILRRCAKDAQTIARLLDKRIVR